MTKLPIKSSILTATLLLSVAYEASASTYALPSSKDGLIGTPDKLIYTKAKENEDFLDIARRYNLGQNQIIKANRNVDNWDPGKPTKIQGKDKEGNQFKKLGPSKDIRIPNSYLLPMTARNGIVLNLPEYRLYYYRHGQVTTHPISIGRVDWNTPLGVTSIISKIRNPTWTPPASIRREHAAKGEILPAVFPAGPNNPLGLFAMRLGRASYLIHSTNKPAGLGMRVSHGCIRMYPEDIERIFPSVTVGTKVHIVNQPIKVGWSNGNLYVESHPDLEDKQRSFQQRLTTALNLIEKVKGNQHVNISGATLKKALEDNNGIPVAIYKGSAQSNQQPSIVNVSGSYNAEPATVTPRLVTQQPPRLDNVVRVNPNQPTVVAPSTAPAYQASVIAPSTTPISQPPVLLYNTPSRLPDSVDYNAGNSTLLPPTTPMTNNIPPVPRLNDTIDNNQTSQSVILQDTPSSPPRLNAPAKPQYSILKSAVPPN